MERVYGLQLSRIDVPVDTRDKSILNKHLQNTPRNNYTLWTTYDVNPQWTVGGGAIYQSMGWANNPNTGYVPESGRSMP